MTNEFTVYSKNVNNFFKKFNGYVKKLKKKKKKKKKKTDERLFTVIGGRDGAQEIKQLISDNIYPNSSRQTRRINGSPKICWRIESHLEKNPRNPDHL